ncbi:MAG: hypothetical protein WC788_05515 [Candidatus Paceibacterota bacterium]|jgi:hypothetical protein
MARNSRISGEELYRECVGKIDELWVRVGKFNMWEDRSLLNDKLIASLDVSRGMDRVETIPGEIRKCLMAIMILRLKKIADEKGIPSVIFRDVGKYADLLEAQRCNLRTIAYDNKNPQVSIAGMFLIASGFGEVGGIPKKEKNKIQIALLFEIFDIIDAQWAKEREAMKNELISGLDECLIPAKYKGSSEEVYDAILTEKGFDTPEKRVNLILEAIA